MTSKEAFKEARWIMEQYHKQFVKEGIELKTVEDYPLDKIERDLEVLQELKEILLKSHKTTEHLIDNDTGKREDVEAILPVIYVKGKIKEWLEE